MALRLTLDLRLYYVSQGCTRTVPWQFRKWEKNSTDPYRLAVELNSTAIEGTSDESNGACQKGVVIFPTHNS